MTKAEAELELRVARAIYESHKFVRAWDHPRTVEMWHVACRREARAAIKAYREAMEGMLR